MGLRLSGCANIVFQINVPCLYSERSVVYICQQAVMGILEPIAIKKIKIVQKQGQFFPLYVDTFNRTHNESDLCTAVSAQASVQAYLDAQAAAATALSQQCPVR